MNTPRNGDDYRKGASDYANEELERLRAENHYLRGLLSEHGICITASPVKQIEPPAPRPPHASVRSLTSSSTAEDKIALFRRLFRGRDDVYAIRWRGKDGKTGYSPASLKNWDRRDAQGRPERTFLPLTHEALQNHLTGRETIGVYPLLPDETCWFLAADFDKEGWKEDALAFVHTCEASGIPAALERSRSGKGGHVWIFFQHNIPAPIARKLGTALLTRTMERRHQIGLDSYDRLFPNQDTMPKGGFGNLIALPLQAEPRREGNSVFVDECFNAYPDQWEYLSRRPLVTLAEVEAVVTEIERSGSLIGLRSFDDDESIHTRPWQAPRSLTAEKLHINEPLPAEVRIVRANLVYIDKTGLPSSFLNRVLRTAAFQNPEFYRNQAMRLSTFGKPRVIRCGEELPLFIGLPRGCFQDVMDLMQIHSIQPSIQDERSTGSPLPLKFRGTLFPEQEKAVGSLITHDDGVLSATTAFGKTVVAARMIAERRVNTLVLVHRKQLLDQWRERLAVFLDIPIREIGAIGGGKKAPTKNLDVAVIQSLGRAGEINEVVAEYGHVIVDECHHLSAFSFEQVLRKVKAKYVLGLTATPTRKDGHDPIIFMQCGPVRFKVDARKHAALQPFEHVVRPRATAFQLPPESASLPIHDIYRLLVENERRNAQILEDIIAAVNDGRSPIVLTGRKTHADWFAAALEGRVANIVSLQGGQGAKERKAIAARLTEIGVSEQRVIIATGSYIGEGFDDTRLDTLFLTFPISWSGTLQQYVGRLHRSHAGKTEVRVYDYVDDAVPVLSKMFQKRRKGYASVGYSVQDGLLG